MGWPIWVIVLIPVAVSILSLLFKPPREEPRRPVRGRAEGAGGAAPGRQPRRSISDIDQFLEEINRRRREAAARRRPLDQPTAAPAPPPVARPTAPRPRPVPPPPPVRPTRPLEETERALPSRVRLPEPERVVVAEVVLPTAGDTGRTPRLEDVPAPPPAVVVRPQEPASPALGKLLPMLRSPESLRAAIVVREILDRPLARSRRPGPLPRRLL